MSLTMYDSVTISEIPADAVAVAAYVDGAFRNAAEASARFPRAHLLTIAVFARDDAECLDIENGDATPDEAPAWVARQKARGVARPCLYASASVMEAEVIPALLAADITRQEVRLWSAHYSLIEHICGPRPSCGLLSISADATQWTDQALGRDLDASLVGDGFFGSAPTPVPSPVPSWQEAMMQALPALVKQGDTGQQVRTVQALCTARGHTTAVDGAFGPATALSVKAVQRNHGLKQDAEVGEKTWPVLLGV